MVNSTTKRVFKVGQMIGQDELLYSKDREYTYIAGSELYTYRLEKDTFEKMLKEFPEIKQEIEHEANLRKLAQESRVANYKAIFQNESKLIIRKFNEVNIEQNYAIMDDQKIPAIRRKEVQYRRSTEFIYKSKRLRNAIPP